MKAALEKWFLSYLGDLFRDRSFNSNEPVDVMFCLADHFEPWCGQVDAETQRKRVRAWTEGYPELAEKFKDSDGRPPQHTWFFPPHEADEHLLALTGLCKAGFGEIELHLHHDHILPVPDTAQTLEKKILTAVDWYARHGHLGRDKEGKVRFGFVHGDWALDNSRGGKYCGVNNELQVLAKCGCYADFTFPSINEAQPRKINTIYCAKDDPEKPKSYDTGIDVRAGGKPYGDLMLVEGPLGIRTKNKFPFIGVEAANISSTDIPTGQRIDLWIKTAIRVQGAPNWVFVKVHTHGAMERNADVFFGGGAEKMHEYLRDNYNDGKRFRLHYVAAREMYNIIKAAEKGEIGDPGRFRDYLINKPTVNAVP